MDVTSGYSEGNEAPRSQNALTIPTESSLEPNTPVKYTPVTGRISRAKKGVPVHTCDICRPVKTFTRAEHLRRHQLSHQKPAYPCTFEECERAFHRPDLLARHLHRHETQGEKAYKAGDPRSRASSSASESRTPSLKVEMPSFNFSNENSITASSYSTITSSFKAVNFQASLGSTQPEFAPKADTVELVDAYPDEMNYTTTPQLPLLRIPEDNWIPGLSYNNSPWCSSSSSSGGSTFTTSSSSTHSSGRPYIRTRLSSVAAMSDSKGHGRSVTLPPEVDTAPKSKRPISNLFFTPNVSSDVPMTSIEAPERLPSIAQLLLTTPISTDNDRGKLSDSILVDNKKEVLKETSNNTPNGVTSAREHDSQDTSQCHVVCGAVHSTGGCWTCLLFGRRCGKQEPSCYTCERLELDCDYVLPSWWYDANLKQDQKSKINRFILTNKASQAKKDLESYSSERSRPVSMTVKAPVQTITSLATNNAQNHPTLKVDCSTRHAKSPVSDFSTTSDPSAGFETDSSTSGEETDWGGDDAMPNVTDILDSLCHQAQSDLVSEGGNLECSVLSPLKRALVERLMRDFWTIFSQEWSKGIRKCAGTPSAPPSASTPHASTSGSRLSQNTISAQKRRIDNSEDSPEDGNEDLKRHRRSNTLPADPEDSLKFACPYRKHAPRKYNHFAREWRSCALTSFSSVARVKGHLYQRHRIFQCERCSELFKDEHKLKDHFMAVKTCDLKPPITVDGITCKLERQLRSRKKTHNTQTQEDRWKAIYRILFPLEIIPSPYFEPLHEEATGSPVAIQLSDYEDYSRRELPRIFKGALEEAVNQEAEPIAERLRNQLINMIQECQERVFSTYRSRMTPSRSSPLPRGDTYVGRPNSIRGPIGQGDDVDGPILPDMDSLLSFFQPPPYQHDAIGFMDIFESQGQNTAYQNERSDSGYASNLSEHQNQSSTAIDKSAPTRSNVQISESREHSEAHLRLGDIDSSQMSGFSHQFLPEDAPTTTCASVIENDLSLIRELEPFDSWQLP
ncbi:uncharacterized protein PAC_18890 [Phialocephala subalpina]|uniref:C2H2-type domain-containing protein n=1 Tax=Phialocephala subalpina TaxID=576137 RepID=A0A1L7XVG1_9HELO|nr:uncharacterized protein PAC_18890 [Phialocephala subalpina]